MAVSNTKESFVRDSTSIVRIANEGDEMCFSYAFALALAKAQHDKDPGNSTHYTTGYLQDLDRSMDRGEILQQLYTLLLGYITHNLSLIKRLQN